MSLSATFYVFEKRPNSTKTPLITDKQEEMFIVLKERCSIISPVLVINYSGMSNPIEFNYCVIPAFDNRFYFVEDWVNVRGSIWEVSLKIDVMGTYKTDILNSEQFVIRSYTKSDMTLPDTLAVGKTLVNTIMFSKTAPLSNNTWSYVVEINGTGTNYYSMDYRNYEQFFQNLFSDPYADTVLSNWTELYPQIKTELNPLQYIGSIRVYPMSISGGTTQSTVKVGWGEVVATGNLISPRTTFAQNMTFDFPVHPQSGAITFTKYAPYSEYSLFFPPFAEMPIDSEVVGKGVPIIARMIIDIATGNGRLVVFPEDLSTILGVADAKIGIDVRVGQVYNSELGLGNLLTAGANVAGNVMRGNVAGAIGSASGFVEDYLGSLTPKMRSVGANGGISGFSTDCYAIGRFQNVQMPDVQHVGYNYYKRDKISNFNGFVLCDNSDIKTRGTYGENEEIERIMNSGFYVEN